MRLVDLVLTAICGLGRREPPPPPPPPDLDVAAELDDLADTRPDTLDWRTSIVDLLKLIGLDSSLQARRQLAQELGYTGGPDSAAMNAWLHPRVIEHIRKHGIELPTPAGPSGM